MGEAPKAPRRVGDANVTDESGRVVMDLADELREQVPVMTSDLHTRLLTEIPALAAEPSTTELLVRAIESSLETLAHVIRQELGEEEIAAPHGALEYAMRLAQRDIPQDSFLRAYRLGQEHVMDWALDRLGDGTVDPRVALVAGRAFARVTFRYIDGITEQMLQAYGGERERWVAQRSAARLTTVSELLAGRSLDPATVEPRLGHRLGRHHVGLVIWQPDPEVGDALPSLEGAAGSFAAVLENEGAHLFVAQDSATAWAWVSLGDDPGASALSAAAEKSHSGSGVCMAVGRPAFGIDGFRATHEEARRAQQVALVGADVARDVTCYGDPEVRTAALLAGDLDTTREMVRATMGGLASGDDRVETLRTTLMTYFACGQSYAAAAQRLYLHKNTVKYRVEKAMEVRGIALDVDRLNLELALVACRWLGAAVLEPG